MKKAPRHLLQERAVALIELMISTSIVAITGGILYYILNTGMVLFAKNTAINIAHQEARVAVLQMEQDLHSAVSIPTLIDTNKNAVSGSGPAAGISFQLFAGGPFQVTPSSTGYPTGQSQITVRTNGYTPAVGQRLIIPTHQIELDITAVGAGATDRTLTLASNLPVAVYTKLGPSGSLQDVNVTCFITDRVYYMVSGSQLLYGRDQFVHRRYLVEQSSFPRGEHVSQCNGALSGAALYLPVTVKTDEEELCIHDAGCPRHADDSVGVCDRVPELHRHGEPECRCQ